MQKRNSRNFTKEVLKMIMWKYTILSDAGTIITRDPEYAEMKSKLGCRVFCKRETNFFKYHKC